MKITDYYIFKDTDPEIFKSTDKHIKQGDEDGTLATTLDCLRKDLQEQGFTEELDETIKKLVTRLVYKQRNYGYVPKKRLPDHAVAMGSTFLLSCGK